MLVWQVLKCRWSITIKCVAYPHLCTLVPQLHFQLKLESQHSLASETEWPGLLELPPEECVYRNRHVNVHLLCNSTHIIIPLGDDFKRLVFMVHEHFQALQVALHCSKMCRCIAIIPGTIDIRSKPHDNLHVQWVIQCFTNTPLYRLPYCYY